MSAVYAQGLVVVPRTFRSEGPNGRPGRPREGWTLHLEDCRHAKRAKDVLPAPADGYPDTIECYECHPSDPHRYTSTEVDGAWLSTCGLCDITGTGSSQRSAESSIDRKHQYAASAIALAAARAALGDGEPLLVIVPRKSDNTRGARPGGWTLHRDGCVYLERSKAVWPAPERPRPGTADCVYCAPSSKHYPTYTPTATGKVRGLCGCGHDTVASPSHDAARAKLKRLHDRYPDGPVG